MTEGMEEAPPPLFQMQINKALNGFVVAINRGNGPLWDNYVATSKRELLGLVQEHIPNDNSTVQ